MQSSVWLYQHLHSEADKPPKFFFLGGGGGAQCYCGLASIVPCKVTGKHSPRTQTHGVQILKVFRFLLAMASL